MLVQLDLEFPDAKAREAIRWADRLNAMRRAGADLLNGPVMGQRVFRRGAPEGLETDNKRVWRCSLFDLVSAYADIQKRTEWPDHD